jgi:hypothetical protein
MIASISAVSAAEERDGAWAVNTRRSRVRRRRRRSPLRHLPIQMGSRLDAAALQSRRRVGGSGPTQRTGLLPRGGLRRHSLARRMIWLVMLG